MCKITKNMTKRHGFTLIEILLVLAIMMIFVSFVFSTFYLVNSSHANVIVINDAKDFASLNMEAISKLVVNADHIILSGTKEDVPGHTSVYYNNYNNVNELFYKVAGSPEKRAFIFDQYTVSSGDVKWRIVPKFQFDGLMLIVQLDLFDNANTDSSAPAYYTLTRKIYLSNIEDATKDMASSGTTVIKVKKSLLF